MRSSIVLPTPWRHELPIQPIGWNGLAMVTVRGDFKPLGIIKPLQEISTARWYLSQRDRAAGLRSELHYIEPMLI